jgi:hypothetical protein
VQVVNVAANPEVSNEEAEVETVWTLEDRYGGRHRALGQQRQRKNRI